MTIGEVTDATPSGFADPARRGHLTLVRAAAQEQLNLVLIILRGVLLVGHGKVADAACDGMVGIGDLDPESLQRSVAGVVAADEVQVGTVLRVEPHRVVQVEQAAACIKRRATHPLYDVELGRA